MKPETLFFNFPKDAVPLLEKAAQCALGAGRLARCKNKGASLPLPCAMQHASCALNFILVSDAEIRKLNKKYRNIDRVTDVISFRLSKKPLCGDIYISRGRSKKQAVQMKHSWAAELCYLVLHGALHLFDYTDYTPREKKKMFAVQDRLFARLNLLTY